MPGLATEELSGPAFLFVPVSGAEGAGEYYRSLTIAQGVRRRWPDARIQFIVNRAAGYAAEVPFPAERIDGSPTYNTAAVNRLIDTLRPGVVIFDSAGRLAQLRAARRAGSRVVYISSRFKTRWKGFRLRRMRFIDQHWLAWPAMLEGALTRWERFKLKLMHNVQVIFLDSVFPPLDAARATTLWRSLGIERGAYMFVSAGGGGYQREGVSPAVLFGAAAAELRRATGLATVWVQGPNYAGPPPDPAIKTLGAVTPEQMIDLLSGARLGVINGGSLLLQALAVQTPTVAAPIAGDQPQRIAACAARGLTVRAALETAALVSASRAVLADEPRYRELRTRLAQLGFRNGVDQAVEALEMLMT